MNPSVVQLPDPDIGQNRASGSSGKAKIFHDIVYLRLMFFDIGGQSHPQLPLVRCEVELDAKLGGDHKKDLFELFFESHINPHTIVKTSPLTLTK